MRCFVLAILVLIQFSCAHLKSKRALRNISGLYSNELDRMEEGYWKEYLLISNDGYAYLLTDSTDDSGHILKKIKVAGDKARIKIKNDSIWFNVDSIKGRVTSTAFVFGEQSTWTNWIYYHDYKSHFAGKCSADSLVLNVMSLTGKNSTISFDGDKPTAFDTLYFTSKYVPCIDSLQFPRLRKE